MKRLAGLIPIALLLTAAMPAQTPAPFTALTRTVIDAANANDPAKLAAIYTDDAVVVDENAPFTWRGASAGTQWWAGVQRAVAKLHLRLHVAALSPAHFMTDREGDDAYVTQHLTISATVNGKTSSEEGTQTYTFHRGDNGEWKISRQVWTTVAPVPAQPLAPGTDGPARQMIAAFNKHSADAFAGLYSDDATLIDDLSPLVWDGARAGAKWYSKAMRYLAANGITSIHGTVGTPIESRADAGFAYAIVPVRWDGTANGKPFVQRGSYTMTLQSVNGAWLITSQTWLSAN
jgi:ketosteroid isomerase-like protein